MERLAQKGEETADLSSRLLDLKNYMLDQQLFETKYMVTRVPVTSITCSPALQEALAVRDAQTKK